MNWKDMSIEIYTRAKALFMDLASGALSPAHDWLDRSDHWQIDLNAEDAMTFDEAHND